MGKTADQIEGQIAAQRESLRANINELEARVESAADWRRPLRQNLGLALPLAFVGGVVLSLYFGSPQRLR